MPDTANKEGKQHKDSNKKLVLVNVGEEQFLNIDSYHYKIDVLDEGDFQCFPSLSIV